MKLGQTLVSSMTNISNMFLAKCWRQETSSSPFYDFIKWQYSEIWPFLIVGVYYFSPMFIFSKKWNTGILT